MRCSSSTRLLFLFLGLKCLWQKRSQHTAILRAAPRGSSRARNPPPFGPCPTTSEKSTLPRATGPQVEGDLATKMTSDSRMYMYSYYNYIATNQYAQNYNVFAHALFLFLCSIILNWGDGTTDVSEQVQLGLFNLMHQYEKRDGRYNVKVYYCSTPVFKYPKNFEDFARQGCCGTMSETIEFTNNPGTFGLL